jgi:hypothetical protein
LSQLFTPPFLTVLDSNANPVSGGKVYFYATGTTTPQTVYSDAALTTPATNPVQADSAGRMNAIYLDPSLAYRATVKDAGGTTIKDVDPVNDTSLRDLVNSLTGSFLTTRTINVPSDYSTVAAAFASLAGKRINPDATVTIKVADGTYTLTSGLVLNHPDGDRIRLIGNQTTPASCVITVSGVPTFDALTVSNGYTLGYLDGFKFNLSTKAGSANNYTAILALNGATIICGQKIVVNNWYYGIAARVGSSIVCDYATVSNAGDVGIWAFVGSNVQCRNVTITACSDSTNLLGWGIEAEYGSSIDCQSANVSTCYRAGIGALSGSTVRALSVNSHDNSGYVNGSHGLFAENGGVIEAHSATITNNAGFGIYRGQQAMGVSYGNSITNTGNAFGTDGVGTLFDVVGTNGNPRILFYGPTGADINNANRASIRFTNGNGTQFEIGDTTTFTAVNHLVALGSATGSHVRLAASGTDTNIDVAIEPKGTGVPRFGAWTTNADAPITGYITIKDSGGTTRKLAVIS